MYSQDQEIEDLYNKLSILESSNQHDAVHPVITGSKTSVNNNQRAFGKVGLTPGLAADIASSNPSFSHLQGKSWEEIQKELSDEDKYKQFVLPRLKQVYARNANDPALTAAAWLGGTGRDAEGTKKAMQTNKQMLERYKKYSSLDSTPTRIGQAYARELPQTVNPDFMPSGVPVNVEKAKSVQNYILENNPNITQEDITRHFLTKYGENPEPNFEKADTETVPADKMENVLAIRRRDSEGEGTLNKLWEEYKSRNPQ